MDSARIDELVALVVTWHNRHRLARRITSTQVRSIGVVVLPFVAPEGSGPSARRQVAAFSEDFIAPLTPKQVASFASRHGAPERPGAIGWSQRVVPADAGHESSELALVYLRTASIELGDHRCRVLIGSGPRPRIIGPRAWSVPRIAGASAAATALAASAVMSIVLLGVPVASEALVAASAKPVASAASEPPPASDSSAASTAIVAKVLHADVASAPASAASAVALAASATVMTVAAKAPAASAPAVVSKPKTPTEAPAASDAGDHRAALAIRPLLSSDARAAALLEGKRLRAIAPPNQRAEAPRDAGPVYAVMTVTTRTRAIAERGQLLMDSSASAGELPGKPRSELMQVAGGWRAVLWPFRSREDAKGAQATLSERGIRTDVLEF